MTQPDGLERAHLAPLGEDSGDAAAFGIDASTPAGGAEDAIDRVLPQPATGLDDGQLLAAYGEGAAHADGSPWIRLNFVSSIDGAATHDGRSGGLGDAADRRVFALLRRLADVVLVGAGTVRTEGYGAMALDEASADWRAAHGLAPQPALAIVSGRAELDPDSPVFTQAPVRPLVVMSAEAPAERRAALAAVAEVIVAGDGSVEPLLLRAALAERGLVRVHGEGGPRLAGALLSAGVVDEFCLTLSPLLEGGTGPRILDAPLTVAQRMRLALLLRSGSTLLARYVRNDGVTAAR